MLEDQIRRMKVGYRISSELAKKRTEPDKVKHSDRLLVQREEAMGDDPWEGLGYLGGVAESFLKHPYKTYKLWKKGKDKN